MKLAVRVVNALPLVLKIAAVPALEIAASVDGTLMPSSPCPAVPPPRIRVFVGAPVILKTPSTLGSRSTTATVTGRFNCAAAETACAINVWTSLEERSPAVARFGGAGGELEPGVGTAPASSGGPPPVCPPH